MHTIKPGPTFICTWRFSQVTHPCSQYPLNHPWFVPTRSGKDWTAQAFWRISKGAWVEQDRNT